jgi:hypothetical protein
VYVSEIVDLGRVDDDGKPVTSLILRESDEQTRAAATSKSPTGKAQIAILRALRNRQSESKTPLIWSIEELRKIGRDLGQSKSTARSAVDGLVCTSGLLAPSVGGHRLLGDAKHT